MCSLAIVGTSCHYFTPPDKTKCLGGSSNGLPACANSFVAYGCHWGRVVPVGGKSGSGPSLSIKTGLNRPFNFANYASGDFKYFTTRVENIP